MFCAVTCYQNTNEDGFPVMGDILDGNLDDKTWNKQLLENLPKHFTLEQLENVVYVADSAFVTEDSLRAAGTKLKFISRFPEIYNLASALTNAAFVKEKWIELGQISSSKKSAFYQAQEFKKELHGQQYRFLVVHSDHLDKRKLRGLNRRLEKQKTDLEKQAQELLKLDFACEADAKDALYRLIKDQKNDFYPLTGNVEKTTVQAKRHKRGRPAKDEAPLYQEIYKASVQVGELDPDAYQQEKERLSCFVLISNIFHGYSPAELLKKYKQQTSSRPWWKTASNS